ncbi:MAG: hypothetical protein JO137_08245 [Hyphomicrobiales bacterium]|nr:hypothetical protein [Hyphomicrobiales bacterium]
MIVPLFTIAPSPAAAGIVFPLSLIPVATFLESAVMVPTVEHIPGKLDRDHIQAEGRTIAGGRDRGVVDRVSRDNAARCEDAGSGGI